MPTPTVPRRIVCFGDSITQAQGCAEMDRWTVRLAYELEESNPGEYEVFSRGVGANTTALALDRIQNDVIPLLPGLVLVEFGINDAYINPWAKIPRVSLPGYVANVSEIIRQVRLALGEVVLIINHPITRRTDLHVQGNGQSLADNLEPYSLAAKQLALREGVSALDLPALFNLQNVSLEEVCAEDGVHLSPLGNRVYARVVRSALGALKILPSGDAESAPGFPLLFDTHATSAV